MNSKSDPVQSKKMQQLHEMALAMYRSGDSIAAMKIWRRLKEQDPLFPGLDEWMARASKQVSSAIPKKQETSSTVFRQQRELMAERGSGPKRRVFHPQTSHVQLQKGIRHRHLVAVFFILVLVVLLLSLRNNRSYLIQLNPLNHKLDCYQGNFFPVGWQKSMELDIGIEHDWVKYVENRSLIERFQKGIKVTSREAFNAQIIELFMMLGDESLKQMTERGQQSAIYYFKRISSARHESLVRSKIIRAFLNLFWIEFAAKDFESAEQYLQSVAAMDPSNPDLAVARIKLTEVQTQSGFLR